MDSGVVWDCNKAVWLGVGHNPGLEAFLGLDVYENAMG